MSRGVLGYRKRPIYPVLKRFDMKGCSPGDALIVTGDRFSKSQCPQNDLERATMKQIRYASAFGSHIYARVSTYADKAYTVSFI